MEIILFLPKKTLNAELFLMTIEELFLLEIFNPLDQDLIVYLQNSVIMKVQELVLKVYMKRNEILVEKKKKIKSNLLKKNSYTLFKFQIFFLVYGSNIFKKTYKNTGKKKKSSLKHI